MTKLTREMVYSKWRGEGHPWVGWAKAPLFSAITEQICAEACDESTPPPAVALPPDFQLAWLAPDLAVIIDLPGEEALAVGLACGEKGTRPILAINACWEPYSLIPMEGVVAAIVRGALVEDRFPTGQVAPAFILDRRRHSRTPIPRHTFFDNRWALFEGDLPRAADLLSNGISRVAVVQRGPTPASDLRDILQGYSDAGLAISVCDFTAANGIALMEIVKQNTLWRWFTRFLRWLILFPRRADGSFGRQIHRSHG